MSLHPGWLACIPAPRDQSPPKDTVPVLRELLFNATRFARDRGKRRGRRFFDLSDTFTDPIIQASSPARPNLR